MASIKYKQSDFEVSVLSILEVIFNSNGKVIEIVQGYQNEWRESVEYLSFRINTPQDVCLLKSEVYINDESESILKESKEMVLEVRVDFLGNTAFDNYELLKRGLYSDLTQLDFFNLKTVQPQAFDNTGLEKENWLQRATGSFLLSFEQEFETPVSTINTVEAETKEVSTETVEEN